MSKPIHGVLPIAHTPFLDDDSIDFASLQKQIDWAFATGADGFATGMVSELLRLTFHERQQLTERLGEMVQDRGVFVAGVGAESTKQAIQYAQIAEKAGAAAVMAIPPLSTRAPAAAVQNYFVALAESISIPVIVQDASGYVGQPIPLHVSVDLLKRFGNEKILFKPEAHRSAPTCHYCGTPPVEWLGFLMDRGASAWSIVRVAASSERCQGWSFFPELSHYGKRYKGRMKRQSIASIFRSAPW